MGRTCHSIPVDGAVRDGLYPLSHERREVDAGSPAGLWARLMGTGMGTCAHDMSTPHDGLAEAPLPADRMADAGARKIRPNLRKVRREGARRMVAFALAMCKLGKRLSFFKHRLTGAFGVGPLGVRVRRGEGAELAKSQDAGFEGTGAVEAPAACGYRLGEIEIQRAYRCEGFADAGAAPADSFHRHVNRRCQIVAAADVA